MLKDLIEEMAKALVKHPVLVKVKEASNDQTLLLWLEVAHTDIGRIIGKRGNIINAMRTIVATASAHSRHTNKQITLEIAE